MKTKQVKQYNLSHNNTYKIVGTHYTGGIESGAMCCDNCDKIITNVATIESNEGKQFYVGMDCASTLSGIKDDPTFIFFTVNIFNEAKQIRASLLKLIKKHGAENLIITANDLNDGSKFINVKLLTGYKGNPYWKSVSIEYYDTIVGPMIKELLKVENKCE